MRMIVSTAVTTVLMAAAGASAHEIQSAAAPQLPAAFDIGRADVVRTGDRLEFSMDVRGGAGSVKPDPTGKLAGSAVAAYVWPTGIDPAKAGFGAGEGTLALAVTAHPDFDDTPLFDENGDRDPGNDGGLWHSHWVVLVPDDGCGKGMLKVKDIPPGAPATVPASWPKLPILIASPGYPPRIADDSVRVAVPLADLDHSGGAGFDGVTARLAVNGDAKAPLLCVAEIYDVASGDLSLPGRIE